MAQLLTMSIFPHHLISQWLSCTTREGSASSSLGVLSGQMSSFTLLYFTFLKNLGEVQISVGGATESTPGRVLKMYIPAPIGGYFPYRLVKGMAQSPRRKNKTAMWVNSQIRTILSDSEADATEAGKGLATGASKYYANFALCQF